MFEVDIDESPNTTRHLGVKSVPFLALFQGGQKVAVIPGLTSRERIIQTFGL